MRSRTARILFILFAPITVPLYVAFVALMDLVAGAFYVLVEATLSALLRRPLALWPYQVALLAVPALLLAPFAAAIHLVLWLVRLSMRGLCFLGRWQAGTRGTVACFAAGALFVAAALWTTVASLNASIGSAWIGRPVTGVEAFVENLVRFRSIGELPAEMQERRRAVLNELRRERERFDAQWELLGASLEDDSFLFARLERIRPLLARRMAGIPWYFIPAELSEDGAEHSLLLLGPLLFVWMVLVRWPGTFALLRSSYLRSLFFIARCALATGAMVHLLNWNPPTASADFHFDAGPPASFLALSPAAWLGIHPDGWARPEWTLCNAGLWIALLLLLAGLWRWAARLAPNVGWPRYYVAFLAARLLQRKQIAFFSVGAVTLCVAMMIIVISVMGGFVDSIRERAHGLLGDLVMDGGLQGFPYYQEFIDELKTVRDPGSGKPIIVEATPLIHSYGILQFPRARKTAAVRIWGIRLDEYARVNEFGKDLFYTRRYGETTLGAQPQPVYGYNADGIATLPGKMDEHYRAYLASLPTDEQQREAQKYRRLPGDPFPGPGVFSGPEDKPGYVGREFPGVIIGRHIIARRMPSGDYRRSENYPRGEHCFLTVLPLTRGGDISPEPPPKPSFRYVDDSRTGIHEIDSMNVYVDFETLQKLLSLEPQRRADGSGMAAARCSQIQIKLDPSLATGREALNRLKDVVWQRWRTFRDDRPADPFEYDMLRQVDIQTWEEMQHSYISAIEKEKFLVLIMFGVISIVAVFLILCIFYMIVQEKTRDIGIVKSVGGSAEGVTSVFLAYGGAIGLVGCILGSLLGVVFVEHINDIQDWLARLNPDWRVWSPETYSFDKIPSAWKWSEVLAISLLGIVSSILGAAFPATRAGRTWPVESLRYE